MGCGSSKIRRKDGLFFDDKDAESVDLLDVEERPPQVRNFSITNITCHSFDVAWKAQENVQIERYEVRIFPPEGVRSRSLIKSLTTPTYTFERLKSGTRYTVGVVAVDVAGKRSTCASASESTLPQAATGLEFPLKNISASIFRAEWKASLGDRDYYEISITPTDGVTGKTFISELQDTHYVFTGLVPGTEYRVTIVSVTNDRKSEALEDSVITNPGHVYDLTFPYVTHNEMQLVWKPPVGQVDCYTLTLTSEEADEEPVEIRKIKQTSYKFNGLVTGRSYFCEIYTHAHEKTSLRKVFQQCTLPSEVTNLSATNITIDEATITWSPAPGDSDDYDLFLNPKDLVDGNASPHGVTGNKYTFTGLTPGTKYSIGVVTNSKDKISQRVVAAFLTEPAPCGDITFPKKELKSTQIGIHWTAARGNWESYSILVIKDGGAGGTWKQEDVVQTEYIFTELTPGAEYTFNITTNSEGRHSSSKSATCSTLPCPAGIIAFPTEGITSDSIKVTWSPSAGGVDNYVIRVDGEGMKFEDKVRFDESEYNITKLKPGTTYEISVSVISYGVESEPSVGNCTTGPACVTELETQSLSKNKIRVSWSPPQGGVDSYDLAINPDKGVDCELNPPRIEETSYTFDRLVPGSLYTIAVMPIARGVFGPATSVHGYTVPGDILNVYIPADEITTDTVKVVWRVEGNSKRTLATLVLENEETDPQIISKEVIEGSDHVFRGLQENNMYTIKLQALGSQDLAPAGGQESKGAETCTVYDTSSTKTEISNQPVPTDTSPGSESLTDDIVDSRPPISTVNDGIAISVAKTTDIGHDIHESDENDDNSKALLVKIDVTRNEIEVPIPDERKVKNENTRSEDEDIPSFQSVSDDFTRDITYNTESKVDIVPSMDGTKANEEKVASFDGVITSF